MAQSPAQDFKTIIEGLQGIFGTGESGTSRSDVSAFTQFRPEDLQAISGAMQQLPGQTQAFQNLMARLTGQAQTGVPTLQAQFAPTAAISQFQPQFSTQLDPFSQSLLSQARGDIQQGIAAQAQGAMQRLASQPGLAGALGTIAQIKGMGAANRLPLDIAQQQVGRNLAQQQMLADIQGQFNQQQLQRASQELQRQVAQNQALMQQAGLGQAARQEQMGFGGAGLQAAQISPQILAQIGQMLGKQQTQTRQETEKRGGGLLSNIFG